MGSKEHGDGQERGVTLDLFSDLEPVPPAPPRGGGARGKPRTRRGAGQTRREPASAGARLDVPGPAGAAGEDHAADTLDGLPDATRSGLEGANVHARGERSARGVVPGQDDNAGDALAPGGSGAGAPALELAQASQAALGRSVELALHALPARELQGVVGQVATAIVRSGEFQVALRAQLYTLVAPAISDALRGALGVQEVRQSLREAFGDGAAGAQALQLAQAAALAREAAAAYGAQGLSSGGLPHAGVYAAAHAGSQAGAYAAPPRVAQVVQPLADGAQGGPAAQPLGEAVLLAGYEPALARQYKAALAEAGYEAVIVEVGPNDTALPLEAFTCAIACLADDAAQYVEALVSRHPLRQVLRVSATPRRLVEAVELAMPPPSNAAD